MKRVLFVSLLLVWFHQPVLPQSNFPGNKSLIIKKLSQALELYQQRDLLSLPRQCITSEWITDVWQESMKTEYSYFLDGRLEEILDIGLPENDTSGRITYTYNANNRITEILIEFYQNEHFTPGGKTTFAYDSHNNESERITYIWIGSDWVQVDGKRTTFSYNEDNYVTGKTIEKYISNNWQNTSNEIFTNGSNGYPSQILFQEWDGQWVNSYRYKNIEWFRYDPSSAYGWKSYYLTESWLGTYWNPSQRENASYDTYGGYVSVVEKYSGGSWNNYRRYTLGKYNLVHWTENKTENWNNEQWNQTEGTLNLLTFEGINLTEKVEQHFDEGSGSYLNSMKYEYSDFMLITGMNTYTENKISLQVSPNPAKDHIHLSAPGHNVGRSEVIIYSMSGHQVFHNKNVDADAGYDLDISDLKRGVYLVFLYGNHTIYTQKFIRH